MDNSRQSSGPVSLEYLFDEALQQMQAQQPPPAPAQSVPAHQTDGFIFSGNRHDSVPRALLTDNRLTPLERNAWQVFRLLLNEDGITAFPTYDQLAPWLASMPCATRASHETVARALTLLRLTRWISLVRRRRDSRTGRILGNLYVLHDEPLTPYEAIQLDADYLWLVSQSLDHASKSIQRVSVHTLKEMTDDPLLRGRELPSRLQVLSQRLKIQGWVEPKSYPQAVGNYDSEDGQNDLLRNRDDLSSPSEAGEKTSKTDSLRIPKTDSTVRKEKEIKEISTVPRGLGMLHLPERFRLLKAEQQSGALAALQPVDPDLHQAVLDEWDARCRASTVRNPAGYLFGIIQKAMRGEFRAWAGQRTQPETTFTRTEQPRQQPVDPEMAQAHIARLRSMLRLS
ncbi:STY4528 family pathogenicity island replication protein [Enterobacter sp. DTU_2021_1002640_1_SI_PRY_ASU_LCPMC_013]|uniref:STY4528 family pathogenicity island replication protein n=1 Tax=Enterobacter sp. DTU_2021_1002640_1_SI_PRY_ASU_LCPMC_013 TaxID=3077940 RepID=UPI0028E5E424|nr:STY4528 family pathogenicity island replication protein [Enterobacter sp. DTU_2021_1002640_1_SI_PRY_ASU_LCPMC_013]WNV02817.1 STY4528 family pathogenicity island replication protein [Enterobacter sp. DTU_2021_1002640_1_SI_PRY_ASU_LCPMC_013]